MIIRLEQPADYAEVENLTREAFWNLFVPGCNEHYLVHILRDSAPFIPQLDFVALVDNKIVGNIMYTKALVQRENNKNDNVISFGPLSVLPEFQKTGVGSALINHSLTVAAQLSFGAVIIYGHPAYYHKQGFVSAAKYNISRSDGKFAVALMAKELFPNALKGIEGKFLENELFDVPDHLTEEFDKNFPKKEKLINETQKECEAIANKLE